MIDRDGVSRELQNAFVDEELDRSDWDRMAEQLRSDEALRNEICALRQTKQLVRRAYADVPRGRRIAMRRVRWMSIAALCLLSAAAGWLGHARISDSATNDGLAFAAAGGLRNMTGEKILVHVSSSRADSMATALEEVEDALRAARARGRGIHVEIVANSGGLTLLRADASPFARQVADLRARYPNLTLVACSQTIDRLREQGIRVRLLPGVEVAPSALEQVVKRLQAGWAYVRA
jgi:intracellular sulfur oxidation DsrE/DsrF family protein